MKKILIILLVITLGLILLVFSIPSLLRLYDPDITDVLVEGYVYKAQGKTPVGQAKVVVFNSAYRANREDYTDYSTYIAHDTLMLKTNNEGYYSIKIKRSAYLSLKVFKEGFLISDYYGYTSKRNRKDFYLTEGASIESDLYLPNNVIEIVE
ncbi:MAG: hypothetical protein N4A45_06955 [Flavobacteriales bacterium]|nr:hypothetical protein [Flavobacteriales bacterium]